MILSAKLIAEFGEDIGMLPGEVESIHKRLYALAVATKPPVWGYAGMLEEAVADERIIDVYDVYRQIKKWIDHPDYALDNFTGWNERRMK